jgi:enamine deaminase RidA (YjgF/YER057c/UK114 family)
MAGHSPSVAVDPACGRLVFVSGQIARTSDGRVVGVGDARRQAEYCFERIAALLEDAGGGLADVTRLVYYLTNIDEDLPVVRQVRDGYEWTVPPASTAIGVGRLAHRDVRVEIEATAIITRPSRPAKVARRVREAAAAARVLDLWRR